MTQAPDLIMVAGERKIPLLVEVDLGTESIASRAPNSWASKYARYADYLLRDYGNDPLFEGCGKPLVLVLGTIDAPGDQSRHRHRGLGWAPGVVVCHA